MCGAIPPLSTRLNGMILKILSAGKSLHLFLLKLDKATGNWRKRLMKYEAVQPCRF
jgi:hypothetical protein